MGFVIERFHMNKSSISTGQPEDFATDHFYENDCVLKDGCGMINPHFIFNFGLTNPPRGTNYIRVPTWNNRCYWVREWTYNNGLWEANCVEDFLASFKQQIGAATAYVIRSSNAYNTTIPDTLYPSTTDFQYRNVSLKMPWQTYGAGDGGIFIVGVIGKQIGGLSSISSGAVTYFAFEPTQLENLMSKIFNPELDYLNINWDDIGGFTKEMLASLINPSQYIVSCKWYPFTKEQVNAGVFTKVYVGFWDLDVRAYTITNPGVDFDEIPLAITIPILSDQQRADFLYFSPYTTLKLYMPPFGEIDIDRTDFRSRRIAFDIKVDLITGAARCLINGTLPIDESSEDYYLIKTVDGAFGVDIPLATATVDVSNVGAQLVGSAATTLASGITNLTGVDSLSSGNHVRFNNETGEIENVESPVSIGAIGGMVNTAASAVAIQHTTTTTLFNAGSILNYFTNNWILELKYSPIVNMSVPLLGGLLYETRNIAALGGYMQLLNPHFPIDGNADEIQAIYAQCAAGFIYE